MPRARPAKIAPALPVRQAALLRAINVGGRSAVAMSALRALFERLGLREVQSLLASGNLVFSSAESGGALEARLEAACAEALGLETALFVRSGAEWGALVAANPFPAEAERDPGHLLAMPLKQAPAAAALRALEEAISGRERIAARGRTLYLVYPDGVGRSRLTAALIERKLGASGTARNWNTVLKLAALLRA